mmetsp:Transcript_23878/g.70486  ORF Transcript_23878/g.70486 Transcript_23878/m.70486 type:complete len:383 (-) Transcript_23878:13-1161(-)
MSDTRFPLPYSDNFEGYPIAGEARYFTDQIGSWEIHPEQSSGNSSSNLVVRQMVPSTPVHWSEGSNDRGPLSIIGQIELNDVSVAAMFRLPAGSVNKTESACIGARVNMYFTQGIVLCVGSPGNYTLSYGGPLNGGGYEENDIILSGSTPIAIVSGRNWYTITLTVIGKEATAWLEGWSLFRRASIRDTISGFAAIGCSHWMHIEFDRFHLDLATASTTPQLQVPNSVFSEGQLLGAAPCARNGHIDSTQEFVARSSWQLYHKGSGLCVEARSTSKASSVRLATCRQGVPDQQWRHRYTNIRNREVEVTLGAWKVLPNTLKLVGYKNGVVGATPGGQDEDWNMWTLFPNTGQLRNTYEESTILGYPLCLTVLTERESLVDIL